MKHICKFRYKKRGRAIIKALIRRCRDKATGQYYNLGYDELKRDKRFKRLLLKEQDGYCCYCMRKIKYKEVTLEHIIQHSISSDRIERSMLHYKQFGRLKYVSYQLDFHNLSKPLKTPPFPHCIAYENLVASCNGKLYNGGDRNVLHQCCNNFRGNRDIRPLFYLPLIERIITYEQDGKLLYPEKFKSDIKALGLEHDTLTMMRKIWGRIVQFEIEKSNVFKALKDKNLRANILDDLDLNKKERKDLKLDLYWALLIEFEWFFDYYRV